MAEPIPFPGTRPTPAGLDELAAHFNTLARSIEQAEPTHWQIQLLTHLGYLYGTLAEVLERVERLEQQIPKEEK